MMTGLPGDPENRRMGCPPPIPALPVLAAGMNRRNPRMLEGNRLTPMKDTKVLRQN